MFLSEVAFIDNAKTDMLSIDNGNDSLSKSVD